jgi:hypothetical protein
MLFVIKHEMPITEEDVSLRLSDMVYSASGVEDSSHLQFHERLSSDGIKLWELEDSVFNTKLKGVGLAMLVPDEEEAVISVGTVRTFKKYGTEFATLFVEIFGTVFDMEDLELYTIKGKYIVFAATSPVVLDLNYVITNIKELNNASINQPSS